MVMDSEDREDECDLCCAAQDLTPAQMAFAIRHTTGIICVVADKPRLEGFGLHPATTTNTDSNQTNFYVSTDFLPGTTTGSLAPKWSALPDPTHAHSDSSQQCCGPLDVAQSRTGVSAADRAATARAFCDSQHPPEAFSKPGCLQDNRLEATFNILTWT
eukprot:6123551-Amphidinium_carterae.2